MPKQHEQDISDSVARAKEALGDGLYGGGRIDNFRRGWAMYVWSRGKQIAHYWHRISVSDVRSNCGIVKTALWTTPNGEYTWSSLHGQGDFQRCKRCEKG